MNDEIKRLINESIVIGPNELESYFLIEKTNNLDISFQYKTKETVLGEFFGTYNEKTIKSLMIHDGFTYEIAKKYLKFLCAGYKNNEKFKWLYDKNLIIVDELYFNLYKEKNIVFIGYSKDDPEIKAIIEKIGGNRYSFLKISEIGLPNVTHDILNFINVDEEVKYALNEIASKISDGENPNDFLIYCNSETYAFYLKMYAKYFGLPINFNAKKTLVDTKAGRYVLNNINLCFGEVYETYKNNNKDDNDIETIKYLYDFYELENDKNYALDFKSILIDHEIKDEKIINAINLISSPIFDSSYEIYVLGAIDGFIPKVVSNNDIIDDKVKEMNGLMTSYFKNELINELTSNFILLNNVTFISFSNENGKNKASYMLEKILNFKVKSPELQKFSYSKEISNIYHINYLYRYKFFSDVNDELKITEGLFKEQELFDNSFKGIDRIPAEDNYLSASSLNIFASCHFAYYLQKILKIDSFSSNFNTEVGKYYHEIFEKIYDKDFDFKKISSEDKGKHNFSKKELVLLEKMDLIVEKAANYIRNKNFEHPITKTFHEEELKFIADDIPIQGRVDRINLYGKDLIVIDYKTGSASNDLDMFFKYGTDIQLPFYLFELSKDSNFKKYNIMGAFIQPINIKDEYNFLDEEKNDEKRFKLDGLVFKTEKTDQRNIEWLESCVLPNGKRVEIYGEEKLKAIVNQVESYVQEFSSLINQNNFKINPIGERKKDSCKYCNFSDICFRKNSDYRVEDEEDSMGVVIDA